MMPMKGFLKGLRYISHIFDSEKEEEIQIGLPTDVKHVAHIGMDGPSANTPSWMNKYNPTSESSPGSPTREIKPKPSTKSLAEEAQKSNIPLESPTHRSSGKPKHSRRNHSSNSSAVSEEGDSIGRSKPRRHKLSGDMGSPTSSDKPRRHKHSGDMGSPTSSDKPRRHKLSGDMGPPTERPRRQKHSGDMGSPTERSRQLLNQNTGSDSISESAPKIPKSHRRKSKGHSGGGTSKTSRSKEPDSIMESSSYPNPGVDPRSKENEMRLNSICAEGNECEEISRGIRAL